MSEGNAKVNSNATVNPKAFDPRMRKRLVSSGWFLSAGEWCQSVILVSRATGMGIAIGVSMTGSVKQVSFNRSQQITSDCPWECEGIRGHSCTSALTCKAAKAQRRQVAGREEDGR
jgi:hypothetical protein